MEALGEFIPARISADIIQIETVAFSTVLLVLYSVVLVYIRKRKKHVLLQVISALFIVNNLTTIGLAVLMYYRYRICATITLILCNLSFFLAYWLFSWKYLPTALNFSRLQSTQNCGSTILLYSVSAIIVIVTTGSGIIANVESPGIPIWMAFIGEILMQMFIFVDFLVVLASVVILRRALKKLPHLVVNNCKVWLLIGFLSVILLMGVLRLTLEADIDPTMLNIELAINTLYFTTCFVASSIIAYIMYKS